MAKYDIFSAWAESFLSSKTELMSKPLSDLFLAAYLNDGSPSLCDSLTGLFQYKLLTERVRFLGGKLSPGALVICIYLSSSPGEVVMWAYVLRYLQHKKSLDAVSVEDMAYAFPNGFPLKEELERLWDEQKGYFLNIPGVDNFLDTVDSSIFHDSL